MTEIYRTLTRWYRGRLVWPGGVMVTALDWRLMRCARGWGRRAGFPAGVGMNVAGNTAGMDLTIAGFPRGWILLRREPPH